MKFRKRTCYPVSPAPAGGIVPGILSLRGILPFIPRVFTPLSPWAVVDPCTVPGGGDAMQQPSYIGRYTTFVIIIIVATVTIVVVSGGG